MSSLYSLRSLVRTLTTSMNFLSGTLQRSLLRLAYLPILEPCSSTSFKPRFTAEDRTETGAVIGEDAPPYAGTIASLAVPPTTVDAEPVGKPSTAQCLPYEILAEIFVDLGEILRKEWGGPFFGDQYHVHPAFCWVTLSHVCYRWRDVVLDQSAVWAHNVTSFSRAPRDELVKRARGVPMDALLHVWRNRRPFDDPDFHFLRDHLRNLRSLALWLPENALPALGLVLPAPDSPALNALESLELTLYDAHAGVRMQEFRALPSLRAPSLCAATFRDCFLFLESPSRVTHLEITFRRCYRANTDGALLLPDELSSLLVSCTSLRHLRLGDELPLFTAEATPISLPHLEVLALEGSSTRCVRLLEILDLPESTSIGVRGHHTASPISFNDPVAADNILRAVVALHAHESKASTTARIRPGLSFELVRERSGLRGAGVHLAFERLERGRPIMEVLQLFSLARVAVHSVQTRNDADLNEFCVLLAPTEHGVNGAEIPFPELETLQLSGDTSRSIVLCSASLLSTQERRIQHERPLKSLILSYPLCELAHIQQSPSIQVLEGLLSIEYKPTNTDASSLH